MHYWTIKNATTGFYEVKGSKFYSCAAPVPSEEAAGQVLAGLGNQYPRASHICYAFKTGLHQPKTKCSDDGEPANTAGKPILRHLEGAKLADALIAVVRYFGGVKLGKGGLISAYGNAAKQALAQAHVIQKQEMAELTLTIAYADYPVLLNTLKQQSLVITSEQYARNGCRLTLSVPADETAYWQDWLSGRYMIALHP